MPPDNEPSASHVGPDGKARVTFAAMFVGYTGALDRFEAASKNRDPVATYTALFEALNWAAAVDDRTDQDLILWKKRDKYEWRTRVHDADVMGGIRFVRNSVHHDWSDAVRIDESEPSFPMTFPVVFFEWVWRSAGDLPPPGQKQHPDAIRFYTEQMQGRPVRHSLHALREVFRTLHVILEPSTFTGEDNPAELYPHPEGEEGVLPD
jgi:hypothetical protein